VFLVIESRMASLFFPQGFATKIGSPNLGCTFKLKGPVAIAAHTASTAAFLAWSFTYCTKYLI
jgi:hypothetical protein